MLTDRQKDMIVDHLNSRMRGDEISCKFCIVSDELLQDGPEFPADAYNQPHCFHCPLQTGPDKISCTTLRLENLRTPEGFKTKDYYDATEESIEDHVSCLMDKADKFWGLNLCWKNTALGSRVFNKEN